MNSKTRGKWQWVAASLLLAMSFWPARADSERDNEPVRRAIHPIAPMTPNALVLQQPGGPQRTLDVPRRLTAILKDLKIGQLWVAQNASRPVAIRASLEIDGRVAAALTLNPSDGKPVLFSDRANYRPETLPAETTLTNYLKELRQSAQGVKFGAYVLPSPRGLEVQVYWSGKLVSYMYIDSKNGQTINDDISSREIANSPIRLK
jgi:hypothetical protein